MSNHEIEINELSSSNYEIGHKHGVLCKEAIHAFLGQDLAQINWLKNEKIEPNQIGGLVAPFKKVIRETLPDMFEELEGLSKGAQIDIDEAVLLQIRRELIGTNGFKLMGDCSSFAYRDGENYTSGQTIDLNGDMTSLGRVFKISSADASIPSILMYTFAGLLGYTGMNDAGLTVAINLVISDHWKVGIPPYMMVRKFLEFKTVDECIAFAKSIPIASSRSFTISDNTKSVILELTGEELGIIEGEKLYHTNHYLYPDFIEEDRMNFFSRNSSIKRMQLMESHFDEKGHGIDSIKELLSSHALFPTGICAHNENDVKMNETVGAIIMEPAKGTMHVLKGKTCEEEYKEFQFIKSASEYGV